MTDRTPMPAAVPQIPPSIDSQSLLEADDMACLLVGRFLRAYAEMEAAIDTAIAKLLGVQAGVQDILGANLPMARKVDVLFSAESWTGALPDRERTKMLKETKKAILGLGIDRTDVAHFPFEGTPDRGVVFRRVVAKKGLHVSEQRRTASEMHGLCEHARKTADDVLRIADEIIPFQPGTLDFRDPRNSALLAAVVM